MRSRRTVLGWAPPRLVVMTWGFPGGAASRVRIWLREGAAAMVVRVERQGVEDPVVCAAGWRVHLDHLAGCLRGRPRGFDAFWVDHDDLLRRYGAQAR